MADAPAEDRSGARAVWWVVALTLVGAALYLCRIGAQGLWHDEAVTALRVTRSLAEIWRADPFIGPLHEVLLHFWVMIAGTSEAGLRSLSALFAAASIPVFFALARRLIPARAALIATALFAVSPFTIFFAQEARPYALLMLLTIAAMLAFERAMRTRMWQAWLALALLNAALLYTHFYAAFVLLVQAVGLFTLRGERRTAGSPLAPWAGSVIAALALFAPRSRAVIFAASHAGAGTHALPLLKVPFAFLVFCVGHNVFPANAHIREDYAAALLGAWPIVASALIPIMVGFGGAFLLSLRRAGRDASGRFLLWWCFLPAAVVFAIAAFIPALAAERYFVITFPAFVMLVALGLARPGWPPRVAGAAIIGVLAGALYLSCFQTGRCGWKDHWPEVVAWLQQDRRPDTGIVFLGNHVPPAYRYYASPVMIGATVALAHDTSDAETERQLGRFRGIQLVLSISHRPPDSSRPLRWVRDHYLPAKGSADSAEFPWGDGQKVYRLEAGPGGPVSPGEN